MNFTTITYTRKNATVIISLNRPERMNAVIEEMYLELQTAVRNAIEDEIIRAILITGSSFEKNGKVKQAFCAGADLKKHSTGERSLSDKKAYIQLAHETCRVIYECPKPVIAVINGPARGAGAEMALNCDFILIAENTTIAFPETSLGTCVGGGVTKHLISVSGISKTKELIYTGKVLDGVMAVEYGIALAAYPESLLFEKALDFSSLITDKAPISLAYTKRLIQEATTSTLKTVLINETDAILACMNTDDWHEGIRSFAEKRKPEYKGK